VYVYFQSSDVFTAAKGDRPDAPNVAFLITDANANVAMETTGANAAAVRQQYTHVMALSVGMDPNLYGLWTLATPPYSQSVYNVDSYRDLSALLDTPFINAFAGTSGRLKSREWTTRHGRNCRGVENAGVDNVALDDGWKSREWTTREWKTRI